MKCGQCDNVDNVTMWWKETEMRMGMGMGGDLSWEKRREEVISSYCFRRRVGRGSRIVQGWTWVLYRVGRIVQGSYTGTRAMTCLPPTPSNPPRCDSIFRKFWEVFLGVLSQMDL